MNIINTVENNLIKIKNKTRIRSKQILNVLDLIQLNLKNANCFSIFTTINISHINDKLISLNESWSCELEKIINKINDFLKDESNLIIFSLYSVEIHRDKREFVPTGVGHSKLSFNTIKNTIKNYPHIHLFTSHISYLDEEDLSVEINSVIRKLHKEFISYDIKIKKIKPYKNNLSNILKYIIKEYKLLDVNHILNSFNINNRFYFNVTSGWLNMIDAITNLIALLNKENKSIIFTELHSFRYGITSNFTKKIIDPLSKLELLFLMHLRKRNLRIRNMNVYFNITNYGGLLGSDSKTSTWIRSGSLDFFLSNLASLKEFQNQRSMILKQKKLLLKLQDDTSFMSNLSFNDFEFVEYGDFYLNLHKIKMISKNNEVGWGPGKGQECFKYFKIKKNDLFNKYIQGVYLLQSLFGCEGDFINFLRGFGIILSGIRAFKGNAIYLYGEPNTGKTLISETFLTEIFGEENIAILNFADKKYLLDQVKNKHIIILNEFNYRPSMRESILKIFDSSFIELNVKYRSSEKISINSHKIATSNVSLEDQKADSAIIKRFSIIQLIKSINSREYKIIKDSIPLFIILSLYSLGRDYSNLNGLYSFVEEDLKKC